MRVRLREDSDVLTGEVFVVPRDESRLIDKIEEASKTAAEVDWRPHDISVVAVRQIERNGR